MSGYKTQGPAVQIPQDALRWVQPDYEAGAYGELAVDAGPIKAGTKVVLIAALPSGGWTIKEAVDYTTDELREQVRETVAGLAEDGLFEIEGRS